jgi:hypothetical protein
MSASRHRSLDARLRGLEAKGTARPVHIIWSDTSDRAEWERKKADLIASGKASDGDKFLLVGWRNPGSPQNGRGPDTH